MQAVGRHHGNDHDVHGYDWQVEEAMIRVNDRVNDHESANDLPR